MALLERLLAIFFPIFGIVAVGFLFGRRHAPEMAVANRLNMDVFVPALVFAALAGRGFALTDYGRLACGALLVLLTCALVAAALARGLGWPWKTFVPPMMFNNTANIGLPLALLTWGETALPAAVILFMVENTLHFSLGARLLDRQARLLTLWRIPVVAATVLGILVNITGGGLWPPLLTACRMLGEIAVPLMLFSLGVRLVQVRAGDLAVPLGAAVLRPLLGMGLGWLAGCWLQLETQQAAMLMVFGALPPAVLNFLFAERYRQEPERVAAIVLTGNAMALLILPLAISLVL